MNEELNRIMNKKGEERNSFIFMFDNTSRGMYTREKYGLLTPRIFHSSSGRQNTKKSVMPPLYRYICIDQKTAELFGIP